MSETSTDTVTDPSTGPDPAPEARHDQAEGHAPHRELVVEELLVEDVSIDGMCGVY